MTTPPRVLVAFLAFGVACAANPDRRTLADLHSVKPDVEEVRIEEGLDQAMAAYKRYLAEAPESAMTPEALRRLADLKLEKEYGYLGTPDSGIASSPAPERAAPALASAAPAGGSASLAPLLSTSDTAGPVETPVESEWASVDQPGAALPGGADSTTAGPREAIELYDRILRAYPNYAHNDWVLYQKARAFDEIGRNDEAIVVVDHLIATYPTSHYVDEAQFRRAEYFFTRKKFLEAEESYGAIVEMGPSSYYYELALYKLGWTLYKQELHEEALHRYIALLDHKVGAGYDFDQTEDESAERRIADTYRVISLSFSSLGGPGSVTEYFARFGTREYENRIYRQLGEYYFEKRRYSDAAGSYGAFVDLRPLHSDSARFSMRIIEIYEEGGFPRLVLDAKKDFAARYGLQAEYWQHFSAEDLPQVINDLKANLTDLANHYHALYQDETVAAAEKPAHFEEALRWYGDFIGSFTSDEGTPAIHYQMADLLLEHERFERAAEEYEQIAYGYVEHDQAPAAGYAAIYSHREAEKRAPAETRPDITRAAVDSTLRFVDRFPEHENAAVVLMAAASDLYDMGELEHARETGRRITDQYDEAEASVLRSAWATVAHASFDLEEFDVAEDAYGRVLEITPEEDESRPKVLDSLAASIYKQGEAQVELGEDRAAAKHFLRVAKEAPGSTIRPVADYDAGAAYVRLQDWSKAGGVFDAFRASHPAHALASEATKQMALVFREQGDTARAADEYERVATESDDPELRAEALLTAGEYHEKAEVWDRALVVYQTYIAEFDEPLEVAVETRYKVAELHERAGDSDARLLELRRVVEIDAGAAEARTPRMRVLAGRSALVLAEGVFGDFTAIELKQPFKQSLKRKKAKLDEALDSFAALLDYEAADVTAAATYYMAEIYYEFSQSLLDSERPTGLTSAQALEYEDVLEEEAFPFEERAIEVHEKNLELLADGIYNPWIERSLTQLGDLVPGRYAKFELSPGLIGSMDVYAYQTPNPTSIPDAEPEPDPEPAEFIDPPSEPLPASPADIDDGIDSDQAEPVHVDDTRGDRA